MFNNIKTHLFCIATAATVMVACGGGDATNCEIGQIADCNGICQNAMRLGDGTCDLAGGEVVFDCALHNGDAGDCAKDCNGTPGGNATTDMCGTCDQTPDNDCAQDCLGVWGGAAILDNCGTCDATEQNDCIQDCNGDWGGVATVDNCTTCDANPYNNCSLDCNGQWGGDAFADNCGTCDNDSSNDCPLDCFGVWGGAGVSDECGNCDTDPTNDCVQDCNGNWGGTAVYDDCDVCEGGNGDQDCLGVCFGDAVTDLCGTCDANANNNCSPLGPGDVLEIGTGSYFVLQATQDSQPKIDIWGHEGLVLGQTQSAAGSHAGPPTGDDELPGIDSPWEYLPNHTGMHFTNQPVEILADDDGDDATMSLDFSGWNMLWNELIIFLGDAGAATVTGFGVAEMVCYQDPEFQNEGLCATGKYYQLDYLSTVPNTAAVPFAGVDYHLHLQGSL